MSKKIISLLLILILIVSSSTLDFANTLVNEAKDCLTNLAIPQEYISACSEKELIQMYQKLRNQEIGEVEYQKVGLNVGEDSGVSTYGYDLPESDMTLELLTVPVTTYIDDDCYKINCINVWIRYNWADNEPTIARSDAVSVNWKASDFMFDGDTFQADMFCKLNSGGSEFKYRTLTNPAKSNDGGLGWYHEFPVDELGYGSRAVVAFELDSIGGAKYKYNYYSEEDYDDGCPISVEYAHDGTPGLGSLSLGYSGVGISITPGVATLWYSKLSCGYQN